MINKLMIMAMLTILITSLVMGISTVDNRRISNTITATVTVTPAVCGDGIININEQCDDGNTISGDGCSDTCQIEIGDNS